VVLFTVFLKHVNDFFVFGCPTEKVSHIYRLTIDNLNILPKNINVDASPNGVNLHIYFSTPNQTKNLVYFYINRAFTHKYDYFIEIFV